MKKKNKGEMESQMLVNVKGASLVKTSGLEAKRKFPLYTFLRGPKTLLSLAVPPLSLSLSRRKNVILCRDQKNVLGACSQNNICTIFEDSQIKLMRILKSKHFY